LRYEQKNAVLEAAARLLKRIGIDRFVATVRGQAGSDYRMQAMSEG
jgi:hypothetical protein